MRQSPFLCSAAIGTVAVALTILAFFAIVVLNVQQVTRHWSEKVQVTAYLDSVPQDAVLQGWMKNIRAIPGVSGVAYVSPRQALARFRKRLGGEADLLQGVDPDILPASLEISLRPDSRSEKGVSRVVARLRRNPAFSDLRYGRDWLERFESFVSLLHFAGAVLGGFLLFATLFIVANTIKLTLYARRDELEIMTLVGGTPLFIKIPFLIEGAFQGSLGGLVALGATYGLYHAVLQKGLGSLLLIAGPGGVLFLPPSYQVLLLATGTLLGFTGSLLSLRRFVRI